MKRWLFFLFYALPFTALGVFLFIKTIQDHIGEKQFRAWVETLPHTASPQVQILPDTILVDYLDEKRSLAIYLPPGYAQDSVAYPVLYFLDGQSLFDEKIQEGTEWEIDEVLDSLHQQGQSAPIVVGIYNSKRRMREYKPFPSDRWYAEKQVSGDMHAEWIVNDVKPWIDARYRTQTGPESTVIGGASLGGLMAYYMLMEYPETFQRGIIFSPSFWVNQKVYTLHEQNPDFKQQRIFFNAGELETPTVWSIEKMRDILLEAGMPASHIKLDVEQGLGHWHMAWREGFKQVYPWILE